MRFILGKKIGMSQLVNDDGSRVPVTVVDAGPIVVTQIKNLKKDGYLGIQFGYDDSKNKQSKAMLGHLKHVKLEIKNEDSNQNIHIENLRYFKELRFDEKTDTSSIPELGSVVDVSVFSEGDIVRVSGFSKGKGFQGVVKRHGFHGAPRSHGHKKQLRAPGSIGQRFPQRTRKGLRMAGRTGNSRITQKGLSIAKVDSDMNILVIKGSLPGRRGTLLEIYAV